MLRFILFFQILAKYGVISSYIVTFFFFLTTREWLFVDLIIIIFYFLCFVMENNKLG